MGTYVNTAWLRARIERTKASIVAHEDAIDALSAGGQQTYSMDTGQTRVTVTRAQLGSLELALHRLENRLSTLEARLCGAAVIGRPGF